MHRQWGDKQLLCKKNLKEMGRGGSSFKLMRQVNTRECMIR